MAGAKKKWSRDRKQERKNYTVGFPQEKYERFRDSIPKRAVITPSIVVEQFQVVATVARRALEQLCEEGVILRVSRNQHIHLYTRASSE